MKLNQDELLEIFQGLKILLTTYEKYFFSKINLEGRYDLWSFKEVEIAGRKRKEVYFAGLIIQSSYVGFYFMPVYADTELKRVFNNELLSLLKGKSCFHIRKLTPEIKKQIKDALKTGFDLYKKRNWV
ncbi:MAG: DUF1801 domain-containing protein [Spirochaetia bacterium]|nr:DUF1801 domain-containing protein [Spirochaetia bacterium]